MRKPEGCCKNCKHRKLYCHGSCPLYLIYLKANMIYKREERRNKKGERRHDFLRF